MHNPAFVLENDTHTPMGLWHTNGSPNLGQETRSYNNQEKKKKKEKKRKKKEKRELAKLWTLLSQQNKTERKWKEE